MDRDITLTNKIKRIMRPGGRFESIEIDFEPHCDDGSLPGNSAVCKWWEFELQATTDKPLAYPEMEGLLQQSGFTDVQSAAYVLPFHAWLPSMKSVGDWMRCVLSVYDGYPECHTFNGLSMAPFTRQLGWSRGHVDSFVQEVMACVSSASNHGYFLL